MRLLKLTERIMFSLDLGVLFIVVSLACFWVRLWLKTDYQARHGYSRLILEETILMLWQLAACFLPVSWGFSEMLKERNIHLNIWVLSRKTICVTSVIKYRPCRKTQTSGSDETPSSTLISLSSSSSEDSNMMAAVASGGTLPPEMSPGRQQSSISCDSPLFITPSTACNTWSANNPSIRNLLSIQISPIIYQSNNCLLK